MKNKQIDYLRKQKEKQHKINHENKHIRSRLLYAYLKKS